MELLESPSPLSSTGETADDHKRALRGRNVLQHGLDTFGRAGLPIQGSEALLLSFACRSEEVEMGGATDLLSRRRRQRRDRGFRVSERGVGLHTPGNGGLVVEPLVRPVGDCWIVGFRDADQGPLLEVCTNEARQKVREPRSLDRNGTSQRAALLGESACHDRPRSLVPDPDDR